MVKTMKASSDSMLEIYQKRNDKNAVAGYLAKQDAASYDRKTKAEYSRSGKAKIAKKPQSPTGEKAKTKETRTLEQQLAQAKAKAKNKGKKFDPEQSTRWFNSKDLNKDGILDEKELNAKAPVGWNDH
jgi:hypothetical protein